MLVYANHLSFKGTNAEPAIFRGIGGWLKEQLGFGLHPDKLKQEGEFNGHRGDAPSWLRVYAAAKEEPRIFAWVLKNRDDNVRGRQWITELGLKCYRGLLEFSCAVKTDEYSTLVASPVMASRPRVIGYVVNNVLHADDAEFAADVSGVAVKEAGQDEESYHGLLAEIEREGRDCPIVLVSPTTDGAYLINVTDLQEKLVGLGQVVQVSPDFNSYEMAEVIGERRSAWSGALNVLYIPTRTGFVRNRLFLSEEIISWGDTQHDRISHILAWVTNDTNVPRLRKRIRPEGVMQLALRRRLQAVRARGERMGAAQLREELNEAARLASEQGEWINMLEEGNSELESELSNANEVLLDERENVKRQNFLIRGLKDQLENAGGGRTSTVEVEALVKLSCSPDPPTPLQCVEIIENVYGDKCIVLEDARESARSMDRFEHGRRLLDMLRRLVKEYRGGLIDGGDNKARQVFTNKEYAAKESETVMENQALRRMRTFIYEGRPVEMFRHLKIGVDDDVARTIRVHFHWDAGRQKIVIGYCGKHLPVSSR